MNNIPFTAFDRAHTADGDQGVEDLRQAFFPRAMVPEARDAWAALFQVLR